MNAWSWKRAGLLGLALAAGAAIPLHAQVKSSGADPDEAPEAGYAMTGEIREIEAGKVTVCPWQPRFPARVAVLTSPRTRLLRQKKGRIEDLRSGELVLVVEEPPNRSERQQRRLTSKRRPGEKSPAVTARARAVLRCGTPDGALDLAERQLARALLEGARPFFKGESRGGVKKPGEASRLVVGTVTALEPLTVKAPKSDIRYAVTEETLVVEHEIQTTAELKRGQTVLVHSPAAPDAGQPVTAAVLAVSPRPRLRAEQQKKLILRERKEVRG